nr:hypothetical protein [Burkholderia cepacia]
MEIIPYWERTERLSEHQIQVGMISIATISQEEIKKSVLLQRSKTNVIAHTWVRQVVRSRSIQSWEVLVIYSQDDILELATKYPSDFSFRGDCFEIFGLALAEFGRLSKGKWSLGDYKVSIDFGKNESLVAVSFTPLPAYEVNGVPFEIADQGMYKNGRGVTYVYAVENGELLKTIYMR